MNDTKDGGAGVVVAVLAGVLVLLVLLTVVAGVFMFRRAALSEAQAAREMAMVAQREALARREAMAAAATAADDAALAAQTRAHDVVEVDGTWLYSRHRGHQDGAVVLVVVGLDGAAPSLAEDPARTEGGAAFEEDGDGNLRVVGGGRVARFQVEADRLQGLAERALEADGGVVPLILELTGCASLEEVWNASEESAGAAAATPSRR